MALQGNDVIDPDKKTGFTIDGKEILLTKTRGHAPTGLMDKRAVESGDYNPKKQFEAASLYAATGSFPLASEKSGVDEKIIRKWAREPWFREILIDFRIENLSKLDSAFTDIIDKAAIELKDRLENGDWFVTKLGKLVRKPVGIRDLALVQAINIDKRQLIRGEPTSRTESTEKKDVENLLENLANKFQAMIEFKRPKELDVIDAEILEEKSAENIRAETSSTSPEKETNG